MKYVIYISDIDKYLSKNKRFTDNLSEARKFWFFDPSLFFWKNKIDNAGSYARITKIDWRSR